MEPLEPTATDSTPAWTRPAKQRFYLRRALPLLGGVGVIGFSLVTGMLLADEGAAAPTVISIPMPMPVAAVTPVAAPVNVTVTAPEPMLPVVDEPARLRLLTPTLDAECYGRSGADGSSPACSWDNGFPAISGDGRQIADLVVDGPLGPIDVSVVFYDVATSKPIRTITISSFAEFDYEHQELPAARAKVVQRTAAAQRVLTANKFRSLQSLGEHKPGYAEPGEPAEVTGDPKQVHSEWTDATMRLVDPATRTELWRHTFSAPAPKRVAKPDEECGLWEMVRIDGWWDPQARVVVGQLLHHHGGCMCGSTKVTQVFSL